MTYDLDQHSFITTFTGRRLSPVAPVAEDICLADIAHALSNLCRFTGHARHFYSVAQHSVLVSLYVPKGFELEGLLHDATEAYVNDLSRPLKHHPMMTAYVGIEKVVDRAIRQHFRLPAHMSPEVKDVDNRIVIDEARSLLTKASWADGLPNLFDFRYRLVKQTPEQAEHAFLTRFAELQ